MSTTDARADDLVDKLTLEIKAVTLLLGSEEELKKKLDGRVIGYHDESLQMFVKALQMKETRRTGRLVAIALGELILASVLVAAGVAVLIPNVAGIDTISGLIQYVVGRASDALSVSPLSPYISFMEFAIGLTLVLSAFYSLREAASNLKAAGLAVEPREL